MIIRYPTAMYSSVLPHTPRERGDVTFTISGTVPATAETFLKIPPGLELLGMIPKTITIMDTRHTLGDFVYSAIRANRAVLGNTSAQYAIGQVLEFGDAADIAGTVSVLPSPGTEYRLDLSTLDYQAMGLTVADKQYIENITYTQYMTLQDRANQLKQDYLALQISINTDQKEVNEIAKALAALGAVPSSHGRMTDIITQLSQQRDAADQRIGLSVGRTATLIAQIDLVAQQLQALSQVVK